MVTTNGYNQSHRLVGLLAAGPAVVSSLALLLKICLHKLLETEEIVRLLPGAVTITDHVPVTNETGEVVDLTNVRTIRRSNVPDQNYDHTLNVSVGVWIAPTNNFQLLANLIIPLQDDGLRSSVALTVGLSLSF